MMEHEEAALGLQDGPAFGSQDGGDKDFCHLALRGLVLGSPTASLPSPPPCGLEDSGGILEKTFVSLPPMERKEFPRQGGLKHSPRTWSRLIDFHMAFC